MADGYYVGGYASGDPVMVPVVDVVEIGAGGGWGDPYERDPHSVRRDVAEGFVSIGSARQDYGVVLDEDDLSIDGAATEKRRAGGLQEQQ